MNNKITVRATAALIQDLHEPIKEGENLVEELNKKFQQISDMLRDLYANHSRQIHGHSRRLK